MKGFYGILLGSFLILTACDDDPTGPRLHAAATTDRAAYTTADTLRLTISNTSDDEPLIVLACYYGEYPLARWDRRTDDEWEPYESNACLGPTVIGLTVEPGEVMVRRYPMNDMPLEPGTYRIGVYAHEPDVDDFSEIEPTFTTAFEFE